MIVRDFGANVLALRSARMLTCGSLPTEIVARLRDVITSTWSVVVVHSGTVTMESAFGRYVAEPGYLLVTVPGHAAFHFTRDHEVTALTIEERGASPRSPWKAISVPMLRRLEPDGLDAFAAMLCDVGARRRITDDDMIEMKRLVARQLWLRQDRRARDVPHAALRTFWRAPHDARLEAVARESGYTKTYLNDLMRGTTGTALSTWLQGVRMNRARHELVRTADAVAAVGTRCGYDDAAYFSRAFSRFHGIPPSRWRTLPRPQTKAKRSF